MDTTFSIELPTSLLQFFTEQQLQQMTAEWIVWHAWKDNRISQRKAAKLLNLSQKEFLCLLQTPRMLVLQCIEENSARQEFMEKIGAVSVLEEKDQEA